MENWLKNSDLNWPSIALAKFRDKTLSLVYEAPTKSNNWLCSIANLSVVTINISLNILDNNFKLLFIFLPKNVLSNRPFTSSNELYDIILEIRFINNLISIKLLPYFLVSTWDTVTNSANSSA